MAEKVFVHESFSFINKDECSYDVHKYSSQKKFLISPCYVIVLLTNEKLFMAAVFDFVYIITALLFKDLHSFAWYIFERTLGTI